MFEDCFAIDLVDIEGRCCGVVTHHRHFGHQIFWARQTILATGGCGQVYRETTNPEIATGDGHAMAFRAGVPLRDMEMGQFHPTTLYIAGANCIALMSRLSPSRTHQTSFTFCPSTSARSRASLGATC